jgi:hypothetical protein
MFGPSLQTRIELPELVGSWTLLLVEVAESATPAALMLKGTPEAGISTPLDIVLGPVKPRVFRHFKHHTY